MTRPTNPGILYGVAAYGMWGLLPIYLKWLQPFPAGDILAHRILWSLLLLTVLVLALKHGRAMAAIVRTPRLLGALAASAVLIAINWLVYILAVNGGHVADASLGYFINPLVNILLGTLVLRERLGRVELAAVLIAAAGVVWLTITQGRLPVTSLILAISFAFYGLVRKLTPVDAVDGLMTETALLSPLALGWLLLAAAPGGPAAGPGWPLVIGAGVVTAVPLLLFAAAAKRVRFSDLGLLQYIAPTLQLALAVLVFGEPLPLSRLFGFALIWLALVIYASAAVRRARTVAKPE